MPHLRTIDVSLKLPPFLDVKGQWEPDENERKAAWEMYVELVTRISIIELKPNEGLLEEALDSLYTLFGTTREILKKYGPTVAQSKGEGGLSFGFLAVEILNTVLRPVLAYWHPVLEDYESSRDPKVSRSKHESDWDRAKELRDTLNKTRLILIEYASKLAEAAEVPPLVAEEEGGRARLQSDRSWMSRAA